MPTGSSDALFAPRGGREQVKKLPLKPQQKELRSLQPSASTSNNGTTVSTLSHTGPVGTVSSGKRRNPAKIAAQEPLGKVNETAKNAARERTRVKSLRDAFSRLQSLIPNVPPDTKLSKLDVLILASSYIRHLTDLLNYGDKITSSVSSSSSNYTSINGQVDTKFCGRNNLHVDNNLLNHSLDYKRLSDIAINCNSNSNLPPPVSESTDGQSAQGNTRCSKNKGNSLVDSAAIASCNLYSNSGNKYLRPVRKWPMRSRLYAGSVSLDKQVFTTAKRQGDQDLGNPSTSDIANFTPLEPVSSESIDPLVEPVLHGQSDYLLLQQQQQQQQSTGQANLSLVSATGDFSSSSSSSFVNYEWDPCIFEGPGETFGDTDAILGTVVTIDQGTGSEHSTTFSLLDVPTGLLSDLSDLFVPSPGSTCHL